MGKVIWDFKASFSLVLFGSHFYRVIRTNVSIPMTLNVKLSRFKKRQRSPFRNPQEGNFKQKINPVMLISQQTTAPDVGVGGGHLRWSTVTDTVLQVQAKGENAQT